MFLLHSSRQHRQPNESLKELLEDLSNASAKNSYCPHCGSLHVNIDTQFWLEGSEQFWIIALPYCQYCNPEIARRRPFAA